MASDLTLNNFNVNSMHHQTKERDHGSKVTQGKIQSNSENRFRRIGGGSQPRHDGWSGPNHVISIAVDQPHLDSGGGCHRQPGNQSNCLDQSLGMGGHAGGQHQSHGGEGFSPCHYTQVPASLNSLA